MCEGLETELKYSCKMSLQNSLYFSVLKSSTILERIRTKAVAGESVRVPYPHHVSFINFVIVQVKVEEKKVKLKRFEKKELNLT